MKLNPFLVLNKNFDGSCILCNTETSKAMLLNNTGATIVQCIEKGLNEEEIVAEMIATYRGAKDKAKKDVADFLAMLKDKGLLSMD